MVVLLFLLLRLHDRFDSFFSGSYADRIINRKYKNFSVSGMIRLINLHNRVDQFL